MNNFRYTSAGEQDGSFSITQYNELLELIRDLIFTLSPEGSIIELNKVFETFTGWKTSEWIGKQFINLIHPGDTDLVLLRFSNLKKGIITGSIEVRLLKKSGEYIYCDILASPKIVDGKILKIVGIARDITLRKKTEEQITGSEERYHHLFNLSPDGIVHVGRDGYIISANPAQAIMYRYDSADDMIGVYTLELISETSARLCEQNMKFILEGKEVPPVEYELIRKDGTNFYGELTASVLLNDNNEITGYICVTRDVTSRKLAEKALSESEQKFKSAFMTSSDSMYIATLEDGLLLEINSAYIDLFGYSREEAIGKTSIQLGLFANPEDRKKLVSELGRNRHIRNMELTGRRKDGSLIIVSISVSILEFEGRKHQLGVLKDITDEKTKEDALQKSESKYRKLHDSITDAFASVDMDGRLLEWNKGYETMIGYSGEELRHLTYTDITPSKWWKFEESMVAQILQKGHTGVYEKEYRRKDGTVFPIEIRSFLIKDDNGNPTMMWGMVRDISERKRAERELSHAKEIAEKSQAILVSLNQHLREVRENERALISREIHDQLGQSLTALKIDIDWLYNRASPGSEQKSKLKRMIDLVTTTIEDVQRISSELRPSILDDIGLSAAMEWYCEDFSTRTGLPVKMEFENIGFENMNTNLAFYRILQESLTNIIRHACARTAEVKFFKTRNTITLMVQDDGIGISPDKIKSTKSLGLLGMFERIKYAGGDMKISKSASGGTKITVNLPLTKEKA